MIKHILIASLACFAFLLPSSSVSARATIDTPVARLQSIDKITARTLTFEVKTGSTVKFGSLYIKLQACRRAPDIEKPESAAFMQVWEVTDEGTPQQKAEWVFSGWMFASSPGLSAMDHPIYDVWVLECVAPEPEAVVSEKVEGEALEGEGIVKDAVTPDDPAPASEDDASSE